MNKVLRIAIFIMLHLLIISNIIPILMAESEISAYLEQTYTLEKNGGNLYIFYKLEVSGGPGIDNIIFRLPSDVLNSTRYHYIEVRSTETGTINYSIKYSINYTEIIIYVEDLFTLNGNKTIILIIYIPSYIFQEKTQEYKFYLFKAPWINIPISNSKLRVNLPVNTKPINVPPGLKSTQESPTGAPQDQYSISGEISIIEETEDLYVNNTPITYIVTLENTRPPTPPILLLEGNATLNIKIMPSGKVIYSYFYSLINRGLDTLAGDTKVEVKRLQGEEKLFAYTTLNRSLDTEFGGDRYYVELPYVIQSNNILQFKADHIIIGMVNNTGVLGEKINYQLMISSGVDYFIRTLKVRILDPMDNIIWSNKYYNISRFNKFNISGEIKTNILYEYTNSLYYSIPVFIIGVLGLGLILYNSYKNFVLLKFPIDAKPYLSKVKEYIAIMEELIEIEDKYLNKKIRGREYLSRRSKLNKELRHILAEERKIEKKVYKLGEKNTVINNLLDNVNKLISKWNELKRLEEEFLSKKIRPDEYTEYRKNILIDFKTIITRIKSIT